MDKKQEGLNRGQLRSLRSATYQQLKPYGTSGKENDKIVESSVHKFWIESVVSVARTEEGVKNTANIVLVANLFARALFAGFAILDINQILDVNRTITEVEVKQK